MTLPSGIFQYADIAILIFIILMLIMGYFKGFLLQLFNMLIFIAVVFVSWMLAPVLAKTLPLMQANEQFNLIPLIGPIFQVTINTILWFILIVIGLMMLGFFFRPVLKGIGKLPIIKQINQLLGVVLAGIKTIIILTILTLLLSSGLFTNGKDLIQQSWLSQLKPMTQLAITSISSSFDSTGLIAKIMTAQEFSDADTVVLENWLSSKNVPTEVVPSLSKLLRLKPIDSSEMSLLLTWMRENGISEVNIAKFMEQFK